MRDPSLNADIPPARVKRMYMPTKERHTLVVDVLSKMSDEELVAVHAMAPLTAFAHAIRGALRERDPNNMHAEHGSFTPSGNYALVLRQTMRAEAGLPIDSTEEDAT